MTEEDRYPWNWPQLAKACKVRANWQCEECLALHGQVVRSPRTGNPYIIYLQAAHVNHDQWNPEPELRSVCVSCHARYFRKPRQSVAEVLCKRRRALRRSFEAARQSQRTTKTRPSAQLQPGQRSR